VARETTWASHGTMIISIDAISWRSRIPGGSGSLCGMAVTSERNGHQAALVNSRGRGWVRWGNTARARANRCDDGLSPLTHDHRRARGPDHEPSSWRALPGPGLPHGRVLPTVVRTGGHKVIMSHRGMHAGSGQGRGDATVAFPGVMDGNSLCGRHVRRRFRCPIRFHFVVDCPAHLVGFMCIGMGYP